MDLNEPDIADPDARREQLIDDAKQAKREHQAEQNEILEAVKQDEELSHDGHEWVEIGEAEFRVKTELPGDVLDILEGYADAEQNDKAPEIRPLIDAAKHMTDVIRTEGTTFETQAKINSFWDYYYQEHGSSVIQTAGERILGPALERQEQRVDTSFPGDRRRS